ncbi:TAXI family TRAP transporter solute-binding subunit [Calditerrivibrio nitroreducens]|uniref:TRAP transporter solute receptor, TAXI family n=1 Tax=Calditerrivibrio nitroreducens (strain DSM 19672 / NBRC 101217 / Yu37-1) TaxID=768670 RepID=E4TFB2_CALNY|nr:TAXI family TRAP transporter solute-binding subunit [Calditerrivibrio nitroreducens]ADR18451.1 TRAP transporter solute receptor, TAXI family [Calditerrivibrio nitroreducens DSM 19672]
MKKILVMLMAFSVIFSGSIFAAKQTFVTIGTGGVTGVYYPVGGAIARLVNAKKAQYNIKATVESTGGSVYNINSVLSGDLEFGIAQADLTYQAYHGQGAWKDKGAQKKLAVVFGLHNEFVTLVASANSGINGIPDLKGKRVNLGGVGSGQLENSRDLLKAFGLKESDLKAEYIKPVESAGLIQDERLDAFFYTVGHPNGSVSEATSGRIKVKIVPITGTPVEKLIKELPYYSKGYIPVSLYPNAANAKDGKVPSIGIQALLVTSTDVPADVVYAITKEVVENIQEFKKLHPALGGLDIEDMVNVNVAPLHPGALKYFKEKGLKK